MRILHLPITKQWFDMILSGIKKEEYRTITKYYVSRLCVRHRGGIGGHIMDKHKCIAYTFKEFDIVRFTNGYGKDKPQIDVVCLGIKNDFGRVAWGAKPQTMYFVIQLGSIIEKRNIK